MGKIDRDEMKALAREHGIALYSAKMVLKKNWTLEYALILEKPVFNQGVRWLLSVKKKKWLMAFKTFDKGTVFGKVMKVRRYNTLIQVRDKLRYLEKIDTAYIYNYKDHRKLSDYIRHDPFVSDIKEKPAYKPSERRKVDLSSIKERTPVRITLYTGEILEGLVAWVTNYDFELKMDRFLSMVIFKHAVWDATEKDFHRFRQPPRKSHDSRQQPYTDRKFEKNGHQHSPSSNNRFRQVRGFGSS